MRLVIAAIATLTLIVVDHYAFHRPVVASVSLGVTVFGTLLFLRRREEADRRAGTRQPPEDTAERDSAGG